MAKMKLNPLGTPVVPNTVLKQVTINASPAFGTGAAPIAEIQHKYEKKKGDENLFCIGKILTSKCRNNHQENVIRYGWRKAIEDS